MSPETRAFFWRNRVTFACCSVVLCIVSVWLGWNLYGTSAIGRFRSENEAALQACRKADADMCEFNIEMLYNCNWLDRLSDANGMCKR